jgi:hypothetical protein
MIGWIGNIFVIAGLYGVGDKRRGALLFSIIGEICYIIHTAMVGDWAIFAAAWIFLFMVVRAYIKWGQ